MEPLFYSNFSSSFGKFTIIWKQIDSSTLIQRIFLSDQNNNSDIKTKEYSSQIKNKSASIINSAGKLEQKNNGVVFYDTLVDWINSG